MFGQRTGFLLLDQPGEINMVGIRLLPGTEYSFSGIDASQLTDKHIAVNKIHSSALDTAENELKNETISDEEKLAITENLLLAILNKNNKSTNEKVNKIVGLIIENKGNVSIDELLPQLDISYKQLERYFNKHVGLSPKLFARIHRFHYAFSQVRSLQKADWQTVLHNCGYYDQAHFIKDFTSFSGLTPGNQFTDKSTLDDYFDFS